MTAVPKDFHNQNFETKFSTALGGITIIMSRTIVMVITLQEDKEALNLLHLPNQPNRRNLTGRCHEVSLNMYENELLDGFN